MVTLRPLIPPDVIAELLENDSTISLLKPCCFINIIYLFFSFLIYLLITLYVLILYLLY